MGAVMINKRFFPNIAVRHAIEAFISGEDPSTVARLTSVNKMFIQRVANQTQRADEAIEQREKPINDLYEALDNERKKRAELTEAVRT